METTTTTTTRTGHPDIRGWGIDADPRNDPTYPMKDRKDLEQTGYSWDRPEQQPVDQEVLTSIERPNVTAVYGTSAPASGLSGHIRRMAFKESESSYGHWLPLLLADRVNVVEGIIDDISHGHFPNFFKEKGYNARWKHDRKNLLIDLAVTTAITVGVIALLTSKRKRKDR
jgi:hypothetical protein